MAFFRTNLSNNSLFNNFIGLLFYAAKIHLFSILQIFFFVLTIIFSKVYIFPLLLIRFPLHYRLQFLFGSVHNYVFGLYSILLVLFPLRSRPHCLQRGGGFAQAGVPQRFGRATNLQIHIKLSAGIHPRLRETAR